MNSNFSEICLEAGSLLVNSKNYKVLTEDSVKMHDTDEYIEWQMQGICGNFQSTKRLWRHTGLQREAKEEWESAFGCRHVALQVMNDLFSWLLYVFLIGDF